MLKNKLKKLQCMFTDREKRQQLIDFKLVAFCLSNQVDAAVDDVEAFYKVLSMIEIDKNGYATVSFKNHRLYVTVIELEEEAQSENIIFFHIVSIDEERERELEQREIESWIASGEIEVE